MIDWLSKILRGLNLAMDGWPDLMAVRRSDCYAVDARRAGEFVRPRFRPRRRLAHQEVEPGEGEASVI